MNNKSIENEINELEETSNDLKKSLDNINIFLSSNGTKANTLAEVPDKINIALEDYLSNMSFTSMNSQSSYISAKSSNAVFRCIFPKKMLFTPKYVSCEIKSTHLGGSLGEENNAYNKFISTTSNNSGEISFKASWVNEYLFIYCTPKITSVTKQYFEITMLNMRYSSSGFNESLLNESRSSYLALNNIHISN